VDVTGPAGTDWSDYFTQHGYAHAELLGRGMEGVVYALGDGLVGKVWLNRSADELQLLKEFYRELSAQPLPFSTPEILDVQTLKSSAVTIERELTGRLLLEALRAGEVSVESAQECVVTVLKGLEMTTGGPASRALPVLNETEPLWRGHATWGEAMSALAQRRVDAYGDQLRAAVAHFDAKAECIIGLAGQIPSSTTQTIHGDVCPENILIDAAGQPMVLLDWGFLTTEGDFAFDAATAAGFFDMYSPNARRRDDALMRTISDTFGYLHERLLLYRALYAVIGSSAYDASGQDDHFAWCAAQLNREDIIDTLMS